IIAIWAMETNFGGYIGDFDGPETLANMATEGRRRGLAERELYAMMTILERGEARRADLISGWAGAMGQTQFMPSVFLTRAVDWDGDGKKDLWKSKADALASAANYLALAGYSKGEPWGIEVTVPTGFDYSIADGKHRSLAEWQNVNLTPVRGGAFDGETDLRGRLWLPAGANGPKYLIFSNFDVFLNYNRANAYAFSVGLLADSFAGRPGVQAPWPTNEARLNKDEIKQLQAALNAKGYPAGPVDGIAGTGTRRALQSFQKDAGLTADGYPTKAILPYVLQGL
ncbi:MAG: lytic murein transglycosylase, partial [Pseudomonadota bacterium]